MNTIKQQLLESAEVKRLVAENLTEKIAQAAQMIIDSYRNGGKLILFGNGGSAADAQHLAGEMVGRFLKERAALPAIALNTNTSILTALGNDYDFDVIFARQLEAWAKKGDVVIGISTSGNSQNVLKGIEKARSLNAQTIGLTGRGGGQLAKIVHLALIVPSDDTPRIQEAHITIGHILCDIVERALFE
jgi:D-sedoheptulose 7-phosphate isomerase